MPDKKGPSQVSSSRWLRTCARHLGSQFCKSNTLSLW